MENNNHDGRGGHGKYRNTNIPLWWYGHEDTKAEAYIIYTMICIYAIRK